MFHVTLLRPNIRDVAREAGVSATTVSLVLNRCDERISDETRQRVLTTIQRLQYRPSRLARGLPSRLSRTLAIVLPALDKAFADPYFGEIISGIYDSAAEHDYRVVLEVARRNFIRNRRYSSILEDCSVDGLLFIGSTEEHRWVEEFSGNGKPLLLVNNYFRQWDLECVLCDYPSAGRMAADYLTNLGHRHIAHLCGPASQVLTADELTESFLTRLQALGIQVNERCIVDALFTVEGGTQAALNILTAHPEITAFFCGNDKMALGAYQAVRARGKRVGEDVAIVGCDDLPAASIADPPLTTIRLNYYDLGVAACERMLTNLRSKQGAAGAEATGFAGGSAERIPHGLRDRIPARLVERASAGRAKAI